MQLPSNQRVHLRGFTLTELMVAVAILVVIIVGTSRIFGTVSRISAVGNAANDVLQEAAAIEQRIREDISNLAEDGVFAIRCVAVPNDVNGAELLNPQLPPDAVIRADQLVFFTNALETSKTFAIGSATRSKGQATASRIYYGHAFQLPSAWPYVQNNRRAYDADPDEEIVPWGTTTIDQVWTNYTGFTESNFCPDLNQGNEGTIDGVQPEARQWLIVRHPVLLVDDDVDSPGSCNHLWLGLAPNSENGPGSGNNPSDRQVTQLSAESFLRSDPVPMIRDGRVDASDLQMGDLRRGWVTDTVDPEEHWDYQKAQIRNDLLFYPRAERRPRSMYRVDQALTNNVLATACSTFIIEWTYDEDLGAATTPNGGYFSPDTSISGGGPDQISGNWDDNILPGIQVDPLDADGYGRTNKEQPWFGMPDPVTFRSGGGVRTDQVRGVGPLGRPEAFNDYHARGGFAPPYMITPIDNHTINGGTRLNNIETVYTTSANSEVVVYEAFFGYNRDRLPNRQVVNANQIDHLVAAYTPRPTALRITMTLHDAKTNLEEGRTVQFLVRLPRLDAGARAQ